MSDDPYLIPGTDILRNRLGITDSTRLAKVEEDVALIRIAELESGTVDTLRGRWDLAHLQAVHRHIFNDVYDWAGEVRTIGMSKGSDLHPPPHPGYAANIFERLAEDNQLRGLDREAFITKVSQLQSDLFALHPFHEGNTRSTTTFVSLVARQAGWQIAWRDCDPVRMHDLLRESYRSGEGSSGRVLEPLIASVVQPVP